MKALLTPAFLLTAFFVKNDTVNGIIGKTQGVSKAINPPTKPNKNKLRSPFASGSLKVAEDAPQSVSGFARSIVGSATGFLQQPVLPMNPIQF